MRQARLARLHPQVKAPVVFDDSIQIRSVKIVGVGDNELVHLLPSR
jgi:hypothetical protein